MATEMTSISWISLYVLVALMALFFLILWFVQIKILGGERFPNPDGSVDDWHEQKSHYGIAFADTFVSCPSGIAATVLIILGSRWGFYLMALVGFFFLWANVMTTATSLRFYKPKITLMWFIVFPLGSIVGLVFLIWSVIHFNIIYCP